MKFSRKHSENRIAFGSPSNFSNSADSLALASRGILRSGFLCTAWRAAKRKDRFQRMLLPLVLRAVAPSPPYFCFLHHLLSNIALYPRDSLFFLLFIVVVRIGFAVLPARTNLN